MHMGANTFDIYIYIVSNGSWAINAEKFVGPPKTARYMYFVLMDTCPITGAAQRSVHYVEKLDEGLGAAVSYMWQVCAWSILRDVDPCSRGRWTAQRQREPTQPWPTGSTEAETHAVVADRPHRGTDPCSRGQ